MNQPQKNLLLTLFSYASQRGIEAATLSKLTGISLKSISTDEDYTIGIKQWNDLWINLAHVSGDKLFGLHFGESLQLAALGIVGEIIKASSTVGEAVSIAASLTTNMTDLFRMEIIQSNTKFEVHFIPQNEFLSIASFSLDQMIILFMVITIHELDGFLLRKTAPQKIKLPFNSLYTNEYKRVFRCKPINSSKEYSISFDKKYCNQNIISANFQLQQDLIKLIISGKNQKQKVCLLPNRIYKFILENSYLSLVTLEKTAANFNMSPRNLQRKLKKEKITYQELADKARQHLAIKSITSNNHPIKDIAFQLGYNEVSAFAKAFKRWTGHSPVAYQKDMGK
ncbi:MAG: AraC family transcriptional regulator ligand-binding domain-containing protein [Ginsengibacter sp.]